MNKTIRPFSNGSEFEQWDERNCGICQNSKQLKGGKKYKCHIDAAFTEALFGYGKVNKSITDLIGFDKRHFLKDCPFKNFQMKPAIINTSIFKQLRLEI